MHLKKYRSTGAEQMTPQEQQIIEKLVQGHDETWRELFAKIVPRYINLFKKLTQDDNTAEDFTSEACIHLVRAIKNLAD